MDILEYEREGRAAYAAFANTVTDILTAAINTEVGYRLQQVMERAKHPSSLRKKLKQRNIEATTTLENDIKDLAGCRIIFYTNSDVTRFINSGIIDQNFEVLEVKIHHPQRAVEDAAELYISNHYLVRLRHERISSPEYARFADMRCEVQVQTILNHAWAEMAHDTIYKAPSLGDFGGRAMDAIKSRMQKVAHKYLLPAGYEFQKIASDFQRLIDGKALFDGEALEAIIQAEDNNIRAEAIETFTENVLPFYDDLQALYPEIVSQLIEAADRARLTQPTKIETPYGMLPAKTYADIVKGIADILTQYRYLNVEVTFDALRKLYCRTESDDERKPLLEAGKALAKHQMNIWRQSGPVVQAILIERIKVLDDHEHRELAPLLTMMLGEMLESEISGTTNSSATVTFHRGAVVASDSLRVVWIKTIEILMHQFSLAASDQEHGDILRALHAATRPPFGAGYTNDLARLVMNNTRTILEFLADISPTLSLQLLQEVEDWVHRCYWMYAGLPVQMRDDPGLVLIRAQVEAAALAFRDVANANSDFSIYKVLVGFDSVYPPAWEDKAFDYEQAETYRAEQVDVLLSSVDETCADIWFDRISRYARTESNDAATFPVFGNFLKRLAEAKPTIVFGYIDRIEGSLTNFLPGMLTGLMQSAERSQTLARINTWLSAGDHIDQIAWYLRFADPFEEALLLRTLDSAIHFSDRHAVRNVLIAAVDQFVAHPDTLVGQIFLPAIRYLDTTKDFSWVRMPWFSWLDKPIIHALNEEQANVVLSSLVTFPDLEYGAEYIAATIAERWPANVVAFLGDRQAFARTDSAPPRYEALPFSVHQLQQPLAAAPDIVLAGARKWFDADSQRFTHNGGKLIATVFPDLSTGLEERLALLVAGGNEQDLTFVMSVLSAFEGRPCIYELVRKIVAILVPGSPLLSEVRSVLHESGVVSGVFGFAELHAERKELIEAWLQDPDESVRVFASDHLRDLDLYIAAEQRSAEASVAMRRLEYDEELNIGGEG